MYVENFCPRRQGALTISVRNLRSTACVHRYHIQHTDYVYPTPVLDDPLSPEMRQHLGKPLFFTLLFTHFTLLFTHCPDPFYAGWHVPGPKSTAVRCVLGVNLS